MSDQLSLLDLLSATSSPALASGHTLSAAPDGPMIDQCGQDHALASLSARQAKEQGLMMSGTCGPRSTTSSASADLTLSLVSKLQAKTALVGSTLYKLTWKQRATPAGRSISALRASVRRTSDSGSGGLPTPNARDGKDLSTTTAYLAARSRHTPSIATRLLSHGAHWTTISQVYASAMGLPLEWSEAFYAATAMLSLPKQRKPSSKV